MSALIQSITGMNDILPTQTPRWQQLEAIFRRLLDSYGYQEIRTPLLEKTELFCRSIGEVTDIVEKEMYTFLDRPDKQGQQDSLTLRPENTASCVRAGIEHGLFHNQIQKLWYCGAMFRHEKPQKGRYRQFHQVGAEIFGVESAEADAELILLTARLWRLLGLTEVELHLNSLGSSEARADFRRALVDYFSAHRALLDEDSQRRLLTNPLRILDSKNPELQGLIEDAPRLLGYLDSASQAHFALVQAILQDNGVAYRINPRLVRGLDYYNRTVFEWVTTQLGAQGTVCGGGRYDTLVAQIGGKPTPAVGFAVGLERLLELTERGGLLCPSVQLDGYLIAVGEAASRYAVRLAEELRSMLPSVRLVVNMGGGSFKSQFKRADKSGATCALVLGEDELRKQEIVVKPLRVEQEQLILPLDANYQSLVNYLRGIIA